MPYKCPRESELGALTESLEKGAVFTLAGNLDGLRVLDVGCVYSRCGKTRFVSITDNGEHEQSD
jgi:hypothetical protein